MTEQPVEAEVVVDWATRAAWEIFDKSHGPGREPFISVDIAAVIRRHAPSLGPPKPRMTEAEVRAKAKEAAYDYIFHRYPDKVVFQPGESEALESAMVAFAMGVIGDGG